MEFRIADTFTDSLAKLSGDEQKAVKMAAFDLQLNPTSPGMQFHRIENCKDPNFWSIRVSSDIRIIIHKNESSLMMCYVDHHDNAYKWAERRKLETHPKTGAAQIVEVRERIQEIVIPTYKPEEIKPQAVSLFASYDDEELLKYGVPIEWLSDVKAANETQLLELADHLPREAAEALLELATGGKPQSVFAYKLEETVDPFEHPDAKRRFRVMSNIEELERALSFPWEKWAVFLHPDQTKVVEYDFNGPARVSGSAGTGKTVVAIHRAVHLAQEQENTRVLLTTFSDTLANSLSIKLRALISNRPRLGDQIEVHSLDGIGTRLYELNFGKFQKVSSDQLIEYFNQASTEVNNHKFSLHFLITEWNQIVDAWQLKTWESYRDVVRLGRKTQIPESQRVILWEIFEKVWNKLNENKLTTSSEMYKKLEDHFRSTKNPPFDFIIVDEAQDISVPQLKFISSLQTENTNGLFFAGDLGQRIFQQPFSWLSLGVDIRGRSQNLRINYRTSHQIRQRADKLLGSEMTDVDGITEDRRGTISVFNGPDPKINISDSIEEEEKAIVQWINNRIDNKINPQEIAIFVRSNYELTRAINAVQKSQQRYQILDQSVTPVAGSISIATMHLAKGLEFRAVAVIACDDEIIPSQKRIETVTDDSDLKEVYDTERQLLYVACTRARDYLLVSGVKPQSEYLDDLV